MNPMTFEIIKAVLMAIIAGVTIYLIPLIKKKIGNENLELMDRWATNAVLWAEQIMKSDSGAEKKQVVMNILKSVRDEQHINITDEQIEILVEAAVNAIKQGFIEAEKGDI